MDKEQFVLIKDCFPDIVVELRYVTEDNFYGQKDIRLCRHMASLRDGAEAGKGTANPENAGVWTENLGCLSPHIGAVRLVGDVP